MSARNDDGVDIKLLSKLTNSRCNPCASLMGGSSAHYSKVPLINLDSLRRETFLLGFNHYFWGLYPSLLRSVERERRSVGCRLSIRGEGPSSGWWVLCPPIHSSASPHHYCSICCPFQYLSDDFTVPYLIFFVSAV